MEYEAEFLPQIWKDIKPEELELGHGGIDWFSYNAFVDALESGVEMPIDAYDAATWQAVSVLSEISIQQGGILRLCLTLPTVNGLIVPERMFASYKTR